MSSFAHRAERNLKQLIAPWASDENALFRIVDIVPVGLALAGTTIRGNPYDITDLEASEMDGVDIVLDGETTVRWMSTISYREFQTLFLLIGVVPPTISFAGGLTSLPYAQYLENHEQRQKGRAAFRNTTPATTVTLGQVERYRSGLRYHQPQAKNRERAYAALWPMNYPICSLPIATIPITYTPHERETTDAPHEKTDVA